MSKEQTAAETEICFIRRVQNMATGWRLEGIISPTGALCEIEAMCREREAILEKKQ